MRAIVTGGAGFIGSALVDLLLARGDDVVVVDDLTRGREANLKHVAEDVELVRTDIRADTLGRAFERARPEVVFHLAAQVDVRASVARPSNDADINVLGTLNVSEAARAAGARKSSSPRPAGRSMGSRTLCRSPNRPRSVHCLPMRFRRLQQSCISTHSLNCMGCKLVTLLWPTCMGRGKIRTERQASSQYSPRRSWTDERPGYSVMAATPGITCLLRTSRGPSCSHRAKSVTAPATISAPASARATVRSIRWLPRRSAPLTNLFSRPRAWGICANRRSIPQGPSSNSAGSHGSTCPMGSRRLLITFVVFATEDAICASWLVALTSSVR